MLKKFSKRTLYIAFGIFCFILFVYLQFPFELLLDQIKNSVEPMLSKDRSIQLNIKKIRPYWLTGVSLHGVDLTKNSQKLLEIKKVSARLKILPLIKKTKAFSLKSKLYDGSLKANIAMGKIKTAGDLQAKKINLAKVNYLNKELGIPFQGLLGANVDFHHDMKDMNQSALSGTLSLTQGKFGPGALAGFEIPVAIRLDDQGNPTLLKFELKNRTLVPELGFQNNDGQLKIEGKVNIRNTLPRTKADFTMNFGLSQQVKQQFPSIIFDSLLKKAEVENGLYKVRFYKSSRRWRTFMGNN